MDTRFELAYGDVNVLYGGLWIQDHGDYADVVEVTDLDSAAGATNMVLVSIGSVGLYGRNLAENRQRLDTALESGMGKDALASIADRKHRRLAAWAALWEYGYRDIDQEHTIATDRDWQGNRDGWQPDLESYGVDGQLGKWRKRVNGEDGLKRWLARYADIDFSAE